MTACTQSVDGSTDEDPGVDERVASEASALTLTDATTQCQADPRVTLGLVSLDTCIGAGLFFHDTFGGNGRSCGTCHSAFNNFTIDPTFIATLPSTDPLFIAETNPALAGLERPDLMRNFGLILENVDGLDAPTTKFVMRSVPHMFSLSTSIAPSAGDGTTKPPNERTGWSGDGSPSDVPGTSGTLRDFQDGAIRQHYTKSLNRVAGTDFTFATATELDKISAFSHTIGRSNEIDLTTIALADTAAEAGRVKFVGSACNFCHHNAGANSAGDGLNDNFNTGVETVRRPLLDQQGIPHDGGFGNNALNGAFGNGTFNTPPLIEAADTGPFFHTNGVDTIEQAVRFYSTPAFAGGNLGFTDTEISNVGRFLRTLNASFNTQLTLKRLNGALTIVNNIGPTTSNAVQVQLLQLAAKELEDAIGVLHAVRALYPTQQTNLQNAINFINTAASATTTAARVSAINSAISLVTTTTAQFTSTGSITFVMGEGTLMF